MKVELWLAFIAAYAVISAIPGLSVLLVTAQALSHGRKTAFWTVAGDVAGGVVLIALALFGVGAVLAASAALFQIVKWAGVLYMIYLGWREIAAALSQTETQTETRTETHALADNGGRSPAAAFRTGFLVGVLNPKAVLFYVAFLSQFLDPKAGAALQFVILAATSTVIVGVILTGYALLAAEARAWLRSVRARRRIGFAAGGFLIGGGLVTAATR